MDLDNLKGLSEATGKEMLKALESIDSTLKRIEQSLNAEKQHEIIKGDVAHALSGEKYNSTPKDVVEAEYLAKAVQTAIRDTFPKEMKK